MSTRNGQPGFADAHAALRSELPWRHRLNAEADFAHGKHSPPSMRRQGQ